MASVLECNGILAGFKSFKLCLSGCVQECVEKLSRWKLYSVNFFLLVKYVLTPLVTGSDVKSKHGKIFSLIAFSV